MDDTPRSNGGQRSGSLETLPRPVNLPGAVSGRLQRAAQALGRLLLPPRCLHCGAPGEAGQDLCGDCRGLLPRNACACPLCALPLPQPAPACGRCIKRAPPSSAALAPFVYADPLDRWLPRLKFHGALGCAPIHPS